MNRVPIMAKQTLDLFKLFRLVVEKGGLVEVRGEKLRQNFLFFGPLRYEILHGVFNFLLSGYKQENLARDH